MERLSLEPVALEDVDGPLTVYPMDLQIALAEAATEDDPARGHDDVPQYTPEPLVPDLDAVVLDGEDDALDGAYAVDGAGGPRYEYLVGAERVDDVPDDAAVTPIAELGQARRELVGAAIDDGTRATIYPETELGSWARNEFFGGYVEAEDGTTYRGHEIDQTDAAFFSKTVWWVLSLSAVAEAPDAPTLVLRTVPQAVRDRIDRILAGQETPTVESVSEESFPAPVVEFAAVTDYVLTHTAAYRLRLER